MIGPIPDMGGMAGGTVAQSRRLLIPEETIVATGPGNAQMTVYRPFWRPVLAGTLFALTVCTLSWFLMLGFGVGLASNGQLALGGGAAVWLWVTALIAYFCGGFIATSMTQGNVEADVKPQGTPWLKGAVIWALSVPLALGFYALIGPNGGLVGALNLPHAGMVPGENMPASAPHYGFYWSVFIGLACGLIGALVGCNAASMKSGVRTSTP